MLRPNKYSHPDKTIIGLACFLLPKLIKKQSITYSALKVLVKKHIPDAISLLLPTLSFLYMLGKIEYYPKSDLVEYKRKTK